jgi:1-acyl-sn-glycerol-3-phosphate acyltransferase
MSQKATEIAKKPTEKFVEKPTKHVTPEEIEANKYVLDHLFEMDLAKSFCNDVLLNILDKVYFRSELVGFEDYPKRNIPDKPLIFASNHSGMAFPWDAMVFVNKVHQLRNFDADAIRALTAPMLSQSVLMNPYQIPHFWKRVGGAVDATTLNFETMMSQNEHNVLIYPEGVPGIGKGFDKRYQLQRISTSMIRMSVKHKTDIIPVATVNGEYINPYTYSSKWLNKIVNKVGIPFLPLGIITFFILLFPWMFYMAFPAKLTFVLGKRIKPYEMTDKDYEEMHYDGFQEIGTKIHDQMQQELTDAKNKYGKSPLKLLEHYKMLFKYFKYFPYSIPTGWPLLFAEFYQVRMKKKDFKSPLRLGFLSTFRILFQNPMTLAYFIPILGWIPLGLKGFRKIREPKHPEQLKNNPIK